MKRHHQGLQTTAHTTFLGILSSSSKTATRRRFACVDLAGQVHVFGPETGAAKRAPREQYLATDYGELVWDGRLYAVDAATRLPGHLAPAAHARNAFGDAHGRRPPLFDGRHVPQPAGDDRAKGLARASRALPRGLEGPAADAAATDAGGRAAFAARLAVANARADLFHSGPPLAKFQATRHWWPRARDVPERDEPRVFAAPAPAATTASPTSSGPRSSSSRGCGHVTCSHRHPSRWLNHPSRGVLRELCL